jgi:hypothetical protein
VTKSDVRYDVTISTASGFSFFWTMAWAVRAVSVEKARSCWLLLYAITCRFLNERQAPKDSFAEGHHLEESGCPAAAA